jgi:hypothetical protein
MKLISENKNAAKKILSFKTILSLLPIFNLKSFLNYNCASETVNCFPINHLFFTG